LWPTVGGVAVIRWTSTRRTIGQSAGANDVDVTHFGDTAQTGNVTQTGNVIQTGNWTLTGDVNVTGAAVFNEAGADKDFRVEGDTDANLLFVDASTDRVGIGTSSPNEKFVVAGNASVDIYKLLGNTSAPSSTDAFIYRPADNTLGFGTASAERLRIDSSGNVGIGTSSPGDKLVVAASSGAVYAAFNNGTVNTVLGVSAGNVGLLGTTTNQDLLFYANNAERARITTAGLLQFNSGYGSVATAFGCRAWINFDGTLVTNPASTTGIRGSGNVSSVLDNGTGDYTINFTNAMPDGNYAAVGLSKEYDNTTGTTLNLYLGKQTVANTLNANFVRVFSGTGGSGTATDGVAITVAVFR